jgi:hypothetical protein
VEVRRMSFHITCCEGNFRVDIFSNEVLSAYDVVALFRSFFPSNSTVVEYEALPFDLNKEFRVVIKHDGDIEVVEFTEFDSSDVEKILDHRSNYMNAGIWLTGMDALEFIGEKLSRGRLRKIARAVSVRRYEHIPPIVAMDSVSFEEYSAMQMTNLRILLREKMDIRQIEQEKERIFGEELVLVDRAIKSILLKRMDRDLDILLNRLPTEKYWTDSHSYVIERPVLRMKVQD